MKILESIEPLDPHVSSQFRRAPVFSALQTSSQPLVSSRHRADGSSSASSSAHACQQSEVQRASGVSSWPTHRPQAEDLGAKDLMVQRRPSWPQRPPVFGLLCVSFGLVPCNSCPSHPGYPATRCCTPCARAHWRAAQLFPVLSFAERQLLTAETAQRRCHPSSFIMAVVAGEAPRDRTGGGQSPKVLTQF
ncbi:hypothetical protein GN956_G6133 [Arapaima gigas]